MPWLYYSINIVLFGGLLFLISCQGPPELNDKREVENPKNTLIEVNKNLVKSEDQRIEDFISRYHWQMKKTGTGLRYMIYKQGDGEEAEIGRIVRFEYTVSLLSGEDCYTSDDLGPKEFLIGKGGVESGLEEAILLLKKGDRAKFILPSHLAFGLPGDGNKIPSKAAIVYDVNLLEVL